MSIRHISPARARRYALATTGHGALLVMLAFVVGCSKSPPQAEPARTREPVERSSELVATRGPRLYVTNEDSGDISIIDVARDAVVGHIEVGKRPRGVRLSPDERQLFVAVSGSPKSPPGTDESKLPPPDRSADGIAVIDLASGHVVRTLESGSDPESFDVSPDGKLLYVSNEDAARTSILDVRTGKVVGSVAVGGEPEGVTKRPDGKVVYVTSEADNRVDVVDTDTRRVIAKVPTGLRPRAVVFTDDGRHAFVSSELGASVHVIDAQQHRPLRKIAIPGAGARPMGLTLSPDARLLFVSTGRGRSVVGIDVASGKVTSTSNDVGARPWGIAITRDGKKLYTANGPSNDVSVIDAATGRVITRIEVGRSPWGMVLANGRAPGETTVRSPTPASRPPPG